MRKTTKSTGEKIVTDIKRATRKQYSSEEKIRIMLDGFRGEDSIAELCRREGIEKGEIRDTLQAYLSIRRWRSQPPACSPPPEAMRGELKELIQSGQDPFKLPGLHFTQEAKESEQLNNVRSGAVIMAGSGMCTGAQVRHHLRQNLAHADCSLIFVGYAAAGTLARIIIDGAKDVKLFGKRIPVRAKVHTINGFSAHAGAGDLRRWHARTGKPETTFLVHGEEKAMKAFAKALRDNRIDVPGPRQSYEL